MYYNLTKFGQVRTLFLKNLTSRNMSLAQLSGVLNSSSYYILVSLIHTYGFIRKMKIFYTLVDGRLIVWIGWYEKIYGYRYRSIWKNVYYSSIMFLCEICSATVIFRLQNENLLNQDLPQFEIILNKKKIKLGKKN